MEIEELVEMCSEHINDEICKKCMNNGVVTHHADWTGDTESACDDCMIEIDYDNKVITRTHLCEEEEY